MVLAARLVLIKLVIGHWSVSIHLLLVVRSSFAGFVFVLISRL